MSAPLDTQTITALERAIGLVALLALVERRGGTRVYVPTVDELDALDAGRMLVETMGAAAARKLCELRGRETITVPRCAARLRRARDLEIVRRYEEGTSVFALALEYHLTERTIRRVLGNPDLAEEAGIASPAKSRQMELPWRL